MKGSIKDYVLRPELIKRIVIYGLLTLILGSAQCSFFPILKICPSTPDLMMGTLLAISLLDSNKSASVCAVAAGFFIDAVGGTGPAISPLIYLFFVMFIGLFSQKMLAGFPSFALLMIPAAVYRGAATALCIFIYDGGLPKVSALMKILLPEILCTVILCLPVYFIVKLCTVPLETHGKFTF